MVSPRRFAAVSKDGIVTNVLIWDPDAAPAYTHPDGLVELGPGEVVDIGGSFDGQEFARAPVDLANYKARRILAIDAEFRNLTTSLFADQQLAGAIRTAALAGVQEIRVAATRQEVNDAARTTLTAMRGKMESVK